MTLEEFYNKNINQLNDLCDKYKWGRDLIGDTFPKVRENLSQLTGLTETDYFRYIRRAIYNKMIDNTRCKQNKVIYYSYDENPIDEQQQYLQNTIEQQLIDNQEYEEDSKLYYMENEYLSRLLFKYIEQSKNFNEIETFIFRTYALSGLTYKEIEDRFKLPKDKPKNVMRKFRKDLKTNFITYVKQHDYVKQ